MLARVYHKKKKRPLLLTEAGEGGGEYQQQHGGMPRPTMQQQYPQGGGNGGGYAVHSPPLPPPRQSSRTHSSRISRAFGGGGGHDERRGGQDKERKNSAGGLVKKVFGGGKKNHGGEGTGNYGNYGPPANGPGGGGGGGGVMYSDDDECEFDDDGGDCYDEEDEEPQVMRPRRRFVRSGLTTYEQIISKNSMGRRFSRRSYMQPSITSVSSPCKADGKDFRGAASPVKGVVTVDKENAPLAGNADPASAENSTGRGISSLSSALQDVINSRPTALKSVVDPSAAPPRVQRSFVVEQTADGNFFVASKRVPSGPTRQTMDDSFIGMNRQLHDQYGAGAVVGPPHAQPYGQPSAGNPGRRSEMDFMYRQKWGTASALSAASGSSGSSGSTPGSVTTSAASLLSMSKAGVRRRLSGADGAPFVPLGGDSISTAPTAMASAAPRLRRSSSASKIAEVALSNQMGTMYVDETRGRSRSRSTDGLMLPVMPLRKDSAAILLQRGSFEDVDALPMTMDDLIERKPSIDKGPMTMDEFMFDKPAPPPPPPMLQRKGSNGKSGRSKRGSKPDKDDEDEEDNAMNRSFRNLKDVDALKRSRSLEEEEKVVTTTEETETEEEYPDYAEERATDDLGSSYEDESAVRTSNITDFLGGFKSRNSMNRNSLAGRNSLGRNSVGKNDFVSRAARSLRNSRKVALETAKVSSELSRKLREARARVPHDLRGDPPAPAKKRSGFRGRDGKRVRFDMNRYVREFEVIEPEVSDDEVQRWAQRDSEQDDEDEDEEDEHSTDDDSADFGVPVPGAVLAAAMTDANAYYSNPGLNYTYPSRFSVGRQSTQEARPSVGRASIQEDKRVSVVSRRSNANQFEVFM